MDSTHLTKLVELTEKAKHALNDLPRLATGSKWEEDAGRALRFAVAGHRDATSAINQIEHAFEMIIEQTKAELDGYRAETEDFARANSLNLSKHQHLTFDDLLLCNEVSVVEARMATVEALTQMDGVVAKKIVDGLRLWVTNARLRDDNLAPWKHSIEELLAINGFNVYGDQADRLKEVVSRIDSSGT